MTFGNDPIILRHLDHTGVAVLLWGNDQPQGEGTFPHGQEVIDRTFAGITAAQKRMIVHDNAARLHGFA